MKASIIIPTFKRVEFLHDALSSIIAQDFPKTDYDILVVDNAPYPTPELEALCKSESLPILRYIHEPRNGLHNARHAGAKAATGDILIYIDDDVLCQSGWLSAMVAPYIDPLVAAVAGRVTLRYEIKPDDWLTQFNVYYSERNWGDEPFMIPAYGAPVGCNMSVRRDVLYELKGFNPDGYGDQNLIYFRGDGENGLARKIHDMGKKIYYAPRAWVEHRIPRQRISLAYLLKRSALGGIESAYVAQRYKPRSVYGLFFLRAVRAIWGALQNYLFFCLYVKYSPPRYYHLIQAQRYRHKALQIIRQILSKNLRFHTAKEHYFD